MNIYYAIGDVHGRDDLLAAIHERIVATHAFRYPEAQGVIIHLGDYIDGGAKSREVIDRIMNGLPGFEQIDLLGNHESLMLECLETDDRQVWSNWLNNGGGETLKSFDVSFRFGACEPQQLIDALGPNRINWLNSLKLFHEIDGYLFVHAGIVPGKSIDEQDKKDLLWVRTRFLESEADHGFVVVHGHTPEDQPILKHNRIGIDTGATSRGELTCVVIDQNNTPGIMSVVGEVGLPPQKR